MNEICKELACSDGFAERLARRRMKGVRGLMVCGHAMIENFRLMLGECVYRQVTKKAARNE